MVNLIELLLLTVLVIRTGKCQSVNKVSLGFPAAWDGDRYKELYCPSKNIPKFLDGYFLCQLSAAYGDASAEAGHKLNHMIDAIGALGAFHISNGQVVFSAQYYPSRPFKIWEFYDRNMTKASVPWAGWSDYNLTAMSRWEQVPTNPDSARFHPNLDFWKVGKRIIAGTEAPYWVGYEFDVKSLDQFRLFPFIEDNDVFGVARPTMIPISMAIHERNDPDGTLWGSFSAMNFNEQRFYQGIFTVEPSGTRKVVGMYDYGVWDSTACGKDDEYIGDKTQLPGYVHSITSTERYIILPITSLLINPCKFKEPPMTNVHSSIQEGGLWGMDFYDMVPMRFLIFDKKLRHWSTQKPLEVFPSMFVTHQLNAFDNPDGTISADMVVYDSHDPYVKYFYTDFLTKQLYPETARLLRFTIDLKGSRIMYSYLIPKETISADFPQINHEYESRAYQWAYIVQYPFASDNSILKINVDEPAGTRNLVYKAEAGMVLHEPYFVARPGARKEDDGVLLVRALDLQENKGMLIVLDATTMNETGRAYVPISIPFGFHNRYYSKQDLGLPEGFHYAHYRPSSAASGKKSELGPSKKVKTETVSTRKPSTGTSKSKMSSVTRPKKVSLATTSTTKIQKPIQETVTRPTPTDEMSAGVIPPSTIGGKMPRWWPLPETNTDKPWWQKIQQTVQSNQPTWFTNPTGVLPTAKPFTTEEAQSSVEGGDDEHIDLSRNGTTLPPEIAVKQEIIAITKKPSPVSEPSQKTTTSKFSRTLSNLYEETLATICRWLPKVFKSISSDICIENGQKAAKWVQPLASNYAGNFQHILSGESSQAELSDTPKNDISGSSSGAINYDSSIEPSSRYNPRQIHKSLPIQQPN